MEIEKFGVLPENPGSRRWWVGIKFECPNCSAIATLDENDEPEIVKTRSAAQSGPYEIGMTNCPTPDCHTVIGLKEKPLPYAHDDKGNDLTPPLSN